MKVEEVQDNDHTISYIQVFRFGQEDIRASEHECATQHQASTR